MSKQTICHLILCLIILTGCSEKEEIPKLEKGIAIITGHVKNHGRNSKTIRFAAGGVVENIRETPIIDSEGNFKLEIELYHPQNVQAFFKNGYIQLYLNPTDSIHLEIDEELFSKENFPEFKISGTNPGTKISKEIQQYLRYRGENSFRPDAKGKSPNDFLQILNEEINRQDSIVERFSEEHKTSNEFKNWVKIDIIYSVANNILNYKPAHQSYEGLFDKLVFPINDDAAIITTHYPLHLWHYACHIGIWQDTVTFNLLKESKTVEAFQRCMSKITNTVGKGLSRDIMCYKLLLSLLNDSYEDEGYKIFFDKIDKYIENETLKSVLLKKESEYQNQIESDITSLDPKKNEEREISGDFWNELKVKYDGKVVYVDIWATWCSPCRAQIPHAIELHEHFKGQDIAFVNLCLASDQNDWEKMHKNNNIKGDNYFFNNSQTQLLRDKLQFVGYPTYLIIDKQGKLVNKNAPRPSSGEEVRQVLNNWIEKDTP